MALSFQQIRHLLVDLDGVLYRGGTVLEGAPGFVAWLRHKGITFRLVTNNTTLTPQQYVAKLAGMGIAVGENEIYTSAFATAQYLQEHDQGGKTAYVIGQDGILQALMNAQIRFSDDHPDWVIVGLDTHLTYQKLTVAALALEAGAGFLATNSDTSLPAERGLLPGAGAILAALVATTGKQPIVVGKPQPLMLELAMRDLGGHREDTAMVGDRLDTDIAAAEKAEMPSILVVTGVSRREDLAMSPIKPSIVVNNLFELEHLWERPA